MSVVSPPPKSERVRVCSVISSEHPPLRSYTFTAIICLRSTLELCVTERGTVSGTRFVKTTKPHNYWHPVGVCGYQSGVHAIAYGQVRRAHVLHFRGRSGGGALSWSYAERVELPIIKTLP